MFVPVPLAASFHLIMNKNIEKKQENWMSLVLFLFFLQLLSFFFNWLIISILFVALFLSSNFSLYKENFHFYDRIFYISIYFLCFLFYQMHFSFLSIKLNIVEKHFSHQFHFYYQLNMKKSLILYSKLA